MTQEKPAKVHDHHSQRAKARDSGDRKVAFKGVLDNPHRVSWPPVSTNVQNSILAHLMDILEGVAEYHGKCRTNTRKRKRLSEVKDDLQPRNAKKQATSPDMDRDLPSEIRIDRLVLPDTTEGPEPPSILKFLICGINAVTKQLETQIEKCRTKAVLKTANNSIITEERNVMIKYLFVCREDVDPPILIDHLPHLIAIYNVIRQPDLPPITLIPLPKGAEAILAQTMGVRRLAAFAIDSSAVTATERLAIASTIPLVTAPWFSSGPAKSYVQNHIKQLRTAVPRDMKAAKEARTRGKAIAKARRPLSRQ